MGVDVKKILLAFLPYLLALGVLFALWKSISAVLRDSAEWGAWQADTTRTFDSVEVHRMIHDTVQVLNARSDSAAKRLTAVANRLSVVAGQSRAEADRLNGLLPGLRNASDSLQNALGQNKLLRVGYDSLKVSNDSLRGAGDSLRVKNIRLTADNVSAWHDIDSLSALVRRVPKGCRVLGVIRCPVPVLGVGVTSQGFGGFAGIAIPLQ